MSKGSKSTNKPWKAAQPYLLGAADTVNSVYGQNAGTIQDATNQITGLLPGMIEKYNAGNPAVNAAQGYNTDVLSGKFLDEGNPYLDEMLANSNDDIRNQMQAALGAKGLTGGSSYADLISRNIAKNTLATRYGAYNDERSRMATAAGQAPGIAAADAIQISPIMAALQASQTPINAAGQYAGSLGGLLGGYQTQRQSDGGAGLLGGLGSLIGGVAMIPGISDARLKTDISRVGQTDEGLPVYTYRLGGEGPFHMGVMAQEVAAMQPDALGPEVGGYMTVQYGEVR